MSELSSQSVPIQSIYGWYREGKLVVNRNYQRKLVWTADEKQKLIDSILLTYPIPLILIAEVPSIINSQYEILDGLQRLHTILSFVENRFLTYDNRCFDVEEFASAKEVASKGVFRIADRTIPRLSRSEVAKILNYSLPISIIRDAKSEEITDIFSRINSYGHRLSDQERRQAGLLSSFARFVRTLSCELRGDVSNEIVPLYKMPEISIETPSTSFGYLIQAENTFWCKHGILRSTELRDSMDEQVVADIIACILNKGPIERSKEALNRIYDQSNEDYEKFEQKLALFGSTLLHNQVKYCFDAIEKICSVNEKTRLRKIIFPKSTNSFPSVFTLLILAIYEILFVDNKELFDAVLAKKALSGLSERIRNGKRRSFGRREAKKRKCCERSHSGWLCATTRKDFS